MTRISVCIATYNQAAYIKECLVGVLTQDCDADLEILVGEDRSTDGTRASIAEVERDWPGRLCVPQRERNLGSSGNYRDLIARATGDFIALLDGDDFWLPGKLAAQLAFMRAHPGCAAVYTNAIALSAEGELVGQFSSPQPALFDTAYLLNGRNFLNFSSTFFRAGLKDAILAIPGEFIDFRVHLRLSRQGQLGFVNRALAAYRAAVANSMTHAVPDKVLNFYWEALTDAALDGVDESTLLRARAFFFTGAFFNALRRRRFAAARDWVRRVRRDDPRRAWRIYLASAPLSAAIALSGVRRKLAGMVCDNGLRVFARR